jgi:hypothetical protein
VRITSRFAAAVLENGKLLFLVDKTVALVGTLEEFITYCGRKAGCDGHYL